MCARSCRIFRCNLINLNKKDNLESLVSRSSEYAHEQFDDRWDKVSNDRDDEHVNQDNQHGNPIGSIECIDI